MANGRSSVRSSICIPRVKLGSLVSGRKSLNLKTVISTVILILGASCVAYGQSPCEYWQSRVDESVKLPENRAIDEKNPNTVIQATECLLKLEGNKKKARFSGATHLYVSQLFEPATVEVAALFYISYLFYQKWDHADAIALVGDDNQRLSAPKTVKDAYGHYRRWFKKVKALGIVKAREMKIEPLKGKDVRWY